MNISTISAGSFERLDPAKMREKMFQQADADGNGSISKDELKTMLANAPKRPNGASNEQAPDADQLFSEIDTDGDGEISKTEDSAFQEARDAERAAKFDSAEALATSGFSGSTDLMQSLLDALKKGEEDSSDSSTGVSAEKVSAAKEKLIASLLEQLRQKNGSYSATGSTQTVTAGSLFSTSA